MAVDPIKSEQYLRSCSLIVSNRTTGIDLSELRIKFSVKRSDTQTPNTANITVYNVLPETAIQIRTKFINQTVVLDAGYESNHGVIFRGNIKQVIIGRESATDTFMEIIAGDGDRAYNFSVIRENLYKGSTQADAVKLAAKTMEDMGVGLGHVGDLPPNKLARGKAIFGRTTDFLRDTAKTSQSYWSIQNGKITMVGKNTYLPGQQVNISAATGMIGTPQQTNEGVNVKVLINPNIQIAGRVHIDSSSILEQALNIDQIAFAKGDTKKINELLPPRLNADGSYYVLTMEHVGDTRGVPWYTNLICLNINVSANPLNSVQGIPNG